LELASGGSVSEAGAGSIVVPNLSINAPNGNISLVAIVNDVNFLASRSLNSGTPIHYTDANKLSISSDPTWDVIGVVPTSNTVLEDAGGIAISTISVQLAGIAYVDIPVLKLGGANFTSRVEGNAKAILPPGSIGTLGLSVPFAEAQDDNDYRRIEDQTKWVTGRMVVSGSTTAPQSSK
jgi:hypothetical protein